MSWVLAIAGFAALIVLHEFGHFAAAKAVGMRVERFSLFFGRTPLRFTRGETEYGIGWIPAGGFVKISGMDPNEPLPPEVAPRAYYAQPVWKRIVVIAAGPAINVLIAFLIIAGIFLASGVPVPDRDGNAQAAPVVAGDAPLSPPAAGVLEPGDRIVAVDGRRGSVEQIRAQLATHTCAGRQVDGCRAARPARITVEREGRTQTFSLTPRYSAERRRPLVGFAFDDVRRDVGPIEASRLSLAAMGRVTTATLGVVGRIFEAEKRKEISSVVGASKVTQLSFEESATMALQVLAIVSLSLAIINLFPFLPLDGGHILFALIEKLRGGRPVPFWLMERTGLVGFALVLGLFAIGLTNDIGRLTGEGFGPPR